MHDSKPLEFDSVVIRRLFWWAFALRFGAGCAGWILTSLFNLPFLQDAQYYEEIGAGIANDWLAGRSSWWLDWAMTQDHIAWLHPLLIAVFYYLMGGLRIVPVLIAAVCLTASLSPVLIFHAAREAGLSQRGALFAGRLIAFSPTFAFWTGALYKESLLLILLSLGTYHVVRLQQKWSWWSLGCVLASLLGLFGLRFYIAIIMAAVLCIGLVLGRTQGGSLSAATLIRQASILVLFIVAGLALGLDERVNRILPNGVDRGLELIDISRRDLAMTGNSGFAADVNLKTIESATRFLPVGLAYFWFSPMPWQFGEMRQNLAIPETTLWAVVVYPLMIGGIMRGIKRNPQCSIFLLAAIVSISLLYALFAGNIGEIVRMRIQMWVFASIFAGWGWELWTE